MGSKKKKIFLVVFALVFLFICTIVTMATMSIFRADDIRFHFSRFRGIYDAILGGQFPVKFYNGWCYEGGYFGPMFYCDLFLIPFVLLSFLGIPLKVCYFFLFYSIYFALWFAMFFWLKNI